MVEFEEFTFVIPGHSPETIPLARLMEYLREFITVLGDPLDVHLLAINPGSVSPQFCAAPQAASQVRRNVGRFSRGDGTAKQRAAAKRIARMVRDDAPDGTKFVLLRSKAEVLLEIPPAPADPEVVTGIKQPTSLSGQLISVGGVSETASIEIRDRGGETFRNIKAPRGLAKSLAQHLWEPVRLIGMGNWTRSTEGRWQLDRFDVQSYDELRNEGLSKAIENLQNANVQWPEDALNRLNKERGDS